MKQRAKTTTFATLLALALCTTLLGCREGELSSSASDNSQDEFTIDQTLSDEAQKNTIAFAGLAFLTGGGVCENSFLPPGKVADFFGFQYLRDNDSDDMGHNTSFLTRAANNVLYILTDSQVEELIALAEDQVNQINDYAYERFPLLDAFNRLLENDVPAGETLSKDAVMEYSAELFRIDGEVSLERAEVIGGIIRDLTDDQRAYLDEMVSGGMLSWPDLEDQVDPQDYEHDVHVAIMTYASQLFSWYAGSSDADTYFCPEREAMYFGSFYLKDMPAMGNPDYTIDESLTATGGDRFLALLDDAQASLVSGIVDLQRDDLLEVVETRQAIAEELRNLMTEDTIDTDAVLELMEHYGELDGAMAYYYATRFVEVAQTLSDSQWDDLYALRDLDDYPCNGAYLYSENIDMPAIDDTDFLFAEE